jgi:cephalosporin hydroxylase
MSLFRSLFTEHPASVDETYLEHFGSAIYFGTKMIIAGVACVVHGVIPAVFMTRGSDTVRALHERMVLKRRKDSRQPVIE